MDLARKPMAPKPRPKPGPTPKGPKCARLFPADRLSRRDFDRLVARLVRKLRRLKGLFPARHEGLDVRAAATAQAVGAIRYRPRRAA
jgi:hypothetical protein